LVPVIGLANEMPTRVGYAFDKDTMDLLYIEKHYQVTNNNKLHHSWVIYTDDEGNQIAGKTNNFSHDSYMPDFTLKNYLTGHSESVIMTGDEYLVSFSRKFNAKLKEKTIQKSTNGIIDAGFDNSIISSWDKLIKNEVIEKNFLIPSLTRYIKFRIYQSNIIESDGSKLRVINIEPANFIARAFAGTTSLSYDYSAPVLREYNGISNMRDVSGNNFDVVIKYTYILN
jgi:hypothetical protein